MKTIAEIVCEGKTIEAQISYTYEGVTVEHKCNITQEGTGDWYIYNPIQGWVNTWCNGYYSGWSYQEADQNQEADYEYILVSSVNYGDNYMKIEDVLYDSCDGEETEVILETNVETGEMYELETVPKEIKVIMKVTFDIEGDDTNELHIQF